jgi:hypothetical protein
MPKVMLKGLNIRRNDTGKWYVSVRANGATLIKGFSGSRAELDRVMAKPEFLDLYANGRDKKKSRTYPTGTFGALIDWYEALDAWKNLSPRTQADYGKVKRFLEPTFSYSVAEIDSSDVMEMRDRPKALHYAKFSNDVIAYMSAVFREAKDDRRISINPALGIKRLYKAGKDANRRWNEEEWVNVFALAPSHLKAPMAIARWAGMRAGSGNLNSGISGFSA